MSFNVPLSQLSASDGNITYTPGSLLKVGQGSNVTVSGVISEIAGNIGIGTSSVATGNAVAIYGGNLFIAGNLRVGNTATAFGGIQFADGTFQKTAPINPPGASNLMIAVSFTGQPPASQPFVISMSAGNVMLWGNSAGYTGNAWVHPTNFANFNLSIIQSNVRTYLGNVNIQTTGSILFPTGFSNVFLNGNDKIVLIAPTVQDATLSTGCISLNGVRIS